LREVRKNYGIAGKFVTIDVYVAGYWQLRRNFWLELPKGLVLLVVSAETPG
jgi:hypothetical protein